MSTEQAIEQPIILVVGSQPEKLEELVGHNNDFTKRIFGVRPLFLRFSADGVFDTSGSSLLPLLLAEPDKSFNEIKDWIKSDAFAQYAQEHLPASGSEDFRLALTYREHVRLVVIETAEPSPVTDFLQSIFPNALVHLGGFTLQLSEILIEELEVGVRAYNCLKRSGVLTVQDLIEMTQVELDAIQDCGQKTQHEIKEALRVRGLFLRTE